MKTAHILTRAAAGTAASVALLVPLSGCSSDDGMQSTPSGPSLTAGTPAYRNGTYTERGVYGGAPSYMTFTVTIEGGKITTVRSELMPDNNETSRGYQERFAAALPDEVVGKSIDEVQVGVLAGSSSCGDGFNDAIDKIRDKARVGG
ncbi:MAG TPA: hypothetical protein VIW24_05660 [Aldersonia sp.]